MSTGVKKDFSFEQILSLVKQLPKEQKLMLSKELSKELVDNKLTYLLRSFETDQLDLDTITKEVEIVRQEMYDKEKS